MARDDNKTPRSVVLFIDATGDRRQGFHFFHFFFVLVVLVIDFYIVVRELFSGITVIPLKSINTKD